MIPLIAVVRVSTERRHHFRIWLPLFLVWLLLLPLILLLVPVVFVVCLLSWVNPFRALSAGWQLLAGLTGMHVEVAHGKSQILVHVY
jgi:hypothetical protein